MKFYTTGIKAGSIFQFNRGNIKHIYDIMFDGRYLVTFQQLNPQSNIKDYRRCYFAKLDALAAEAGEDRYSMHEHVKDQVVSRMLEEMPELFSISIVSTRSLLLEGWSVLLERLDLWAFIEYGTILN